MALATKRDSSSLDEMNKRIEEEQENDVENQNEDQKKKKQSTPGGATGPVDSALGLLQTSWAIPALSLLGTLTFIATQLANGLISDDTLGYVGDTFGGKDAASDVVPDDRFKMAGGEIVDELDDDNLLPFSLSPTISPDSDFAPQPTMAVTIHQIPAIPELSSELAPTEEPLINIGLTGDAPSAVDGDGSEIGLHWQNINDLPSSAPYADTDGSEIGLNWQLTNGLPTVAPTLDASPASIGIHDLFPSAQDNDGAAINMDWDIPAESPAIAPTRPLELQTDAPVEVPVASPVEPPVEAPTSQQLPVEEPVATPVEQPVVSPVSSPVSSPVVEVTATPVLQPVYTSPPVQAPIPVTSGTPGTPGIPGTPGTPGYNGGTGTGGTYGGTGTGGTGTGGTGTGGTYGGTGTGTTVNSGNYAGAYNAGPGLYGPGPGWGAGYWNPNPNPGPWRGWGWGRPYAYAGAQTVTTTTTVHNEQFLLGCNPSACTLNEDAKFYSLSNEDEAIYEIYYTNPIKCCKVIVEIGAGNGEEFSFSKYYEDALNWRSLLIEADPEYFNQLEETRPIAKREHGAFCNSTHMLYREGKFTALQGSTEITSEIHTPIEEDATNIQNVPCLKMANVFSKYGITHVNIMVVRVPGDALAIIQNYHWPVVVDIWVVMMHGDEGDEEGNDLLDRNFAVQTAFKLNEYVEAEWDVKRWCSEEYGAVCLNNQVFLRKGFNPFPDSDLNRRLKMHSGSNHDRHV